jgi:uroporphyrinogen decarboxylase
VPLIGFSGSPLHPVLLHGRGEGSDSYTQVKRMMYGRPDLMHHILEVTTQAVIDYLNAQIEAGAQAVMVFDSWGGMLSQAAYLEFSLPYMARIMARPDPGTGRPRRAAHRLHQGRRPLAGAHRRLRLRRGGPGLDHRHRRRPPPRGRQGGPAGQHGPEHPAHHAGSRGGGSKAILASYGQGSGHVFNLGHGISQFTPPENVSVLVETVRESSRAFHAA